MSRIKEKQLLMSLKCAAGKPGPQLGLRAGVGLLQIDIPIAQILELYRGAGHCAAHESAGTQNPEFTVEIFDFGFSRGERAAFKTVHGNWAQFEQI